MLSLAMTMLAACSDGKIGGEGNAIPPTSLSVPQTPLTITDASQLIGGPMAQGRVGDLLLSNNQIRVVIQKPTKNAGIGSFGGTIIDADRHQGGDQFGELFPMVNVEWTVNYFNYEVLKDGKDGSGQVVKADGMIDVYDYLDLDWISDAARGVVGQAIGFADRFDDRRNPFLVDDELKDMSPVVTTEYTLEPDTNYVRIDTTFNNPSSHPIAMPVGDFLVAGGALQLLIPGMGFSPPPTTQIEQNTSGVIFSAMEGGNLSYGYFFDPRQFPMPQEKGEMEKTNPEQSRGPEFYKTNSIAYAGLTGVLLGEEFLKILPLGSNTPPDIHFMIEPNSSRTITRYFVVGNGSAGSVLESALKIFNLPSGKLSGQVVSAQGASVEGVTVAVKKLGGGTMATYQTDSNGSFVGLLPTGSGDLGDFFGDGKYEIWIDKEGHREGTNKRAGRCNLANLDFTQAQAIHVLCTLGEKGTVTLSDGVRDAETGEKIPARLTIVGLDPTPDTQGAGTFADQKIFAKPFGIVDVKLINAKGGIGLTNQKSFDLEPNEGSYLLVFSHGPEYSIEKREIQISGGGNVSIAPVLLQRVMQTPGFVSADFHIHALPSPDSAVSIEARALGAAAEGLDVLHSSDHDFLTDYAPVVAELEQKGFLKSGSMQTIVGDEITPNHYGHMHAFPLEVNLEDPDHGAIDWSAHPLDEISPQADYSLSPVEIVEKVLQDPGEEVIQINHIMDTLGGLPVAAGWLTTPIYQEDFGVAPFVSYADPIERRLGMGGDKPPFPPYGVADSELIFDKFNAVELVIGSNLKTNLLWESALPTWFNLLNLGLAPTATGNSDSHEGAMTPLGFPRNYVAVSPFNEESYVRSINNRHVVVSAGPFIAMKAMNEEGKQVGVGDTINGKKIALDILIESPDWAWFDTVEIYMNTEPIPAEDSGRFPLQGEAATPEEFALPYHVPHYTYEPFDVFKVADGSLQNFKVADGKISARLKVDLFAKEDSWVVVVVKGTPETEGYRSLFPIVPAVMSDKAEPPQNFDANNLDEFHIAPGVEGAAWAFTNPIFIDTDGDTDDDGFDFEAPWVRIGVSNLKPFQQFK
ncbi:MAG: CehA/McbA family metallohydrolase [Deltaproteobacteria bacterium]|nr:CehA/McbA family metallohydrolase [Deltaproteobacteria bacterium]